MQLFIENGVVFLFLSLFRLSIGCGIPGPPWVGHPQNYFCDAKYRKLRAFKIDIHTTVLLNIGKLIDTCSCNRFVKFLT